MTDRDIDLDRIFKLATHYELGSKDIMNARRQHLLLVNAVEGFLLGCEVQPGLDAEQVVRRATSIDELVSMLRRFDLIRRPGLYGEGDLL